MSLSNDSARKRNKTSHIYLSVPPSLTNTTTHTTTTTATATTTTTTIRDTGAMLYQLSYEASLEAGQEQVQFIPVI